MSKYIKLGIRVTPKQHKILQAKAKFAGYTKVAFYVRAFLFKSIPMKDKVDAIYKKICGDKGGL